MYFLPLILIVRTYAGCHRQYLWFFNVPKRNGQTLNMSPTHDSQLSKHRNKGDNANKEIVYSATEYVEDTTTTLTQIPMFSYLICLCSYKLSDSQYRNLKKVQNQESIPRDTDYHQKQMDTKIKSIPC